MLKIISYFVRNVTDFIPLVKEDLKQYARLV